MKPQNSVLILVIVTVLVMMMLHEIIFKYLMLHCSFIWRVCLCVCVCVCMCEGFVTSWFDKVYKHSDCFWLSAKLRIWCHCTFLFKVERAYWVSSKHNMGMAFTRKLWTEIKKCGKVSWPWYTFSFVWLSLLYKITFAGVVCWLIA